VPATLLYLAMAVATTPPARHPGWFKIGGIGCVSIVAFDAA
jgi:hypothetical protein